ncbi:MAG: hypothetical protein ACOC1T_02185 [Halorhodospira sp.]
MRIETRTGLVYDESDSGCSLTLATTQGELFAFVVAIDTGLDGQQREQTPYWGRYSHDAPEASIERILTTGSAWPRLPRLEG